MFCTTAKSERVNTESVTFSKRWRKRENCALTKSKCQRYNSGILSFSFGLGISHLTYLGELEKRNVLNKTDL